MVHRQSSIPAPSHNVHSWKEPVRALLCAAGLVVVILFAAVGITGQTGTKPLPPIDPQKVQDQDVMSWDDYHPIPGKNWADPSLKPERPFRLAVVAIDFPDQPFVITL